MTHLAVTWWGHASTTVELGGARVATDPLLGRRLLHLRRASPTPPPAAAVADLVLVSHLHHDHLHVPSLRRFGAHVPVVVPRGAPRAVPALRRLSCIEALPGDSLDVAGVRVEVLRAEHDGHRDVRRGRLPGGHAAPALGFRFEHDGRSCWYPGDTGPQPGLAAVAPVDLALVPIGGWGPSLGEHHLDPAQAAAAVAAVGAGIVVPVHYGTFWPVGLRRLHPRSHRELFVDPPARFRAAAREAGLGAEVVVPAPGERVER
ncbi:MBL fold metallo-hydrolase [Nocardioides zeae]|uniref:L-ascorbate metabolism protein UlaG (Beta-lactamase superfamily) n=1 Tax=Nocardioides zeae TaxID=1457234 RepID=A0AAJ1X0M6_9ACTN|nr:MBL fold metallo-hydrolase [Nocardioides zeae]MDQ1103294.1 L-ascorbate metabolism protein UlaG (beta-lactamase superfamily) [Nocardioides zeae]